MTPLGEPLVGIILAQKDSIFGARSEHPVGFIHSLVHQIINQYADITLVPSHGKGHASMHVDMCVHTGN